MVDTVGFRETFIKAFLSTCKEKPESTKTREPKKELKHEVKREAPAETKKIVDERSQFQKLVDEKAGGCVMVGKVSKVINMNYALGLCVRKSSGSYELVQVLFDVFDFWLRDEILANIGKKLPEVVSPGKYLLVNAIPIEKKVDTVRNVEFMATAVTSAESYVDIKNKELPKNAVMLVNADKVEETKINNFKMVVKAVSNIAFDTSEVEMFKQMKKDLGLVDVKDVKPPPLKADSKDENSEKKPEVKQAQREEKKTEEENVEMTEMNEDENNEPEKFVDERTGDTDNSSVEMTIEKTETLGSISSVESPAGDAVSAADEEEGAENLEDALNSMLEAAEDVIASLDREKRAQ